MLITLPVKSHGLGHIHLGYQILRIYVAVNEKKITTRRLTSITKATLIIEITQIVASPRKEHG